MTTDDVRFRGRAPRPHRLMRSVRCRRVSTIFDTTGPPNCTCENTMGATYDGGQVSARAAHARIGVNPKWRLLRGFKAKGKRKPNKDKPASKEESQGADCDASRCNRYKDKAPRRIRLRGSRSNPHFLPPEKCASMPPPRYSPTPGVQPSTGASGGVRIFFRNLPEKIPQKIPQKIHPEKRCICKFGKYQADGCPVNEYHFLPTADSEATGTIIATTVRPHTREGSQAPRIPHPRTPAQN